MTRPEILLVDDDLVIVELLSVLLASEGYTVRTATSGDEAKCVLQSAHPPRVVIADWEMPGMRGPALCRWLRDARPSPYTYFILLTGRTGANSVVAGLAAGADEFVTKPVEPQELLMRLRTAERVLSLETRDALIFALAKLAESRDPETGLHLERTQKYCRILAEEMRATSVYPGLSEEFVHLVTMTSPLHDIGKVGIPDHVLRKPGKLTPEETEVMKRHTLIGAATLETALRHSPDAVFLRCAMSIARSHHERWDGAGYPDGLHADKIPLEARIMSVADVYDALTSVRVYKSAMSHDQAVAIVRSGRGTQFDPVIVDTFLRMQSRILDISLALQEHPSEPHGHVQQLALRAA